jgi:tRNA A37 threonylcarbamoyladenosine dehydratase
MNQNLKSQIDTYSQDAHPPQINKRWFGGIERLYGRSGLQRFTASHVCVIGIGGVGSWAVESLARSAIGRITMIDMDIVSESNINRQLLATTASIGQDKVLVMQERIAQINPDCVVNSIDDFITRDNLGDYLTKEFDFVIDCIDDFRIKAALINHCKRDKINLIAIGGAGGQTDPAKIKQCDLSKTQHDVLLARTRKLLRQDYAFARNPKRSMGVPCVYSDEQLLYPDGGGGLTSQKPKLKPISEQVAQGGADLPSNALNCSGGLGSISHLTGSFAFHATAFVLRKLAAGS